MFYFLKQINNMKKLFLIPVIAFTLTSCIDSSSDDNKPETKNMAATLTDEEKKEGWQLLFDGETTKGWHSYGDSAAGKAWKVDSGALHLDDSIKADGKIVGGGDLTTDKII